MTQLAKVSVPKTGDSDWSKYNVVKGKLSKPLEAGEQILRITIDSPYANIDKIELKLASTAITSLSTVNSQLSTVYDLQGRKLSTLRSTSGRLQGKNSQLSTPKKGIYIINGKKVIK